MYEKLKRWLQDDTLFGVCLVVLVGVGSFGLGRLSVQEQVPAVATTPAASFQSLVPTGVPEAVGESIPASSPNLVPPPASGNDVVVASRSGTKYHLPSCPGAKQIKPENMIEFSSISAAEAAGYTPAANCPGL